MTAEALYQDLVPRLSELRLPVSVFESLDSTSTECARLLAKGQTHALVIARTQTAGRGRQGRSFFSPPGAGLYLSLLQPMPLGFSGAAGLTQYAAVCVTRAIAALTGLSCGIKWVNDIFHGGKKVCGILCELLPGPNGEAGLVTGIGVNLSDAARAAAPDELRRIMGSLGCPETLAAPLAAAIVTELLRFDPMDRSFLQEYRARSILTGRRVSYFCGGERVYGVAVDIDEEGQLIVRRENGSCDHLASGEVSLLGIEGIR